jgi:hypothetical protein
MFNVLGILIAKEGYFGAIAGDHRMLQRTIGCPRAAYVPIY